MRVQSVGHRPKCRAKFSPPFSEVKTQTRATDIRALSSNAAGALIPEANNGGECGDATIRHVTVPCLSRLGGDTRVANAML